MPITRSTLGKLFCSTMWLLRASVPGRPTPPSLRPFPTNTYHVAPILQVIHEYQSDSTSKRPELSAILSAPKKGFA